MVHVVGRRPPSWVGHVAASLAVLVGGGVPAMPGKEPGWTRDVILLDLVLVGVLLLRRRSPLPTLAVVLVLTGASVPLGAFNSGTAVAAAIATYSVTRQSTPRRSLVVTISAAVLVLGAAATAGEAIPQHVLFILLGGTLGDVIRTHRAHLEAVTERAERAERTREALALQRVAEDRLITARDLHDAVAHQIAVINLHAGVASSALRERPDDAEASLALIRSASRAALTEIGDLLATLRDPGSADTAPVGLNQLDDLVRSFAANGLDVTVRTEGEPSELPRAVDTTALRVLREALTNAHKHGSQHRAHVLVEHLPGELRLTVTNPVDPTTAGTEIGTRQGLVGMAERVDAARGHLAAGTDGSSTWTLTAVLPAGALTVPTDRQENR